MGYLFVCLPGCLDLSCVGLDGNVVVKPGVGGRVWDQHLAALQSTTSLAKQLLPPHQPHKNEPDGDQQQLELPRLEFVDDYDPDAEEQEDAALDFRTPIFADGYSQLDPTHVGQQRYENSHGDGDEEDIVAQGAGGDPGFYDPGFFAFGAEESEQQQQQDGSEPQQPFDPNFFLQADGDEGLDVAAPADEQVFPLRKSGSQPIAIVATVDEEMGSSPGLNGLGESNALVSQQLKLESGLALPPIIAGGTPKEENNTLGAYQTAIPAAQIRVEQS